MLWGPINILLGFEKPDDTENKNEDKVPDENKSNVDLDGKIEVEETLKEDDVQYAPVDNGIELGNFQSFPLNENTK